MGGITPAQRELVNGNQGDSSQLPKVDIRDLIPREDLQQMPQAYIQLEREDRGSQGEIWYSGEGASAVPNRGEIDNDLRGSPPEPATTGRQVADR
jgi:hypothetical protein